MRWFLPAFYQAAFFHACVLKFDLKQIALGIRLKYSFVVILIHSQQINMRDLQKD
ncbi:hypothetical protein HMPREF9996_00994 [Aggregatibacter actinomycetemcomitans Y4]|nr:hypothetical protein ANH9381_0541 [Aggregatibacter actinomycetemcomitans ANH9381]AHN71113.1 hypothetical protein CF65_00555 [Aggregatibacter actinomycetemcomitans HK1651]EKX97128.1 hypothetical protein HMPREF9996_00994 [Aggregatibacter actinomycetemcomitans Y4]